MTINLQKPDITELKPRITVFGVGGGGGNAVNNMINGGLQGVEFVVANTDAQALTMSKAERVIQLGVDVTEGLGAGSQPEVGRAAAEECIDEIIDHLQGTHMAFVTAGMGGGTGTGAAPVVARAARELGILTVGVVTKPFHFEGERRMKTADAGIAELQKNVDTLIVIPNQNLFRIANDKTTFADAFAMADQVLYSGVACITDLMVKEGLINLDFADVRSVMREMGKAMMGTGEASGEGRAMAAAEAAIANPAARRDHHARRTRPADLDHRRTRPDAVRGRRGGDPHPRGSRSGRQHHPRRDLRGSAGGHHPRVGRGDRHRPRGAGRDRALRGQPCRQRDLAFPGSAGNRAGTASAEPSGQCRRHAASRRAATGSSVRLRRRSRPAAVGAIDRAPGGSAGKPPRQGRRERRAARPGQHFRTPAIEEEFRAALEVELAPVQEEDFIPPAAELPEMPFTATRMPEVQDFPPMVQAEMESAFRAARAGSGGARANGLAEEAGAWLRRARGRARAAACAPAGPFAGSRGAAGAQARTHQNPSANAPQAGHGQGRRQSVCAQAARVSTATGESLLSEKTVSEDDQLEIPAFLRRQSS